MPTGVYPHKKRPVADRFWPKVDRRGPNECWPWLGGCRSFGYGSFDHLLAHRVAYELLVGPIPAGLTLDHLCRNHGCVNPAHLESVSNYENVMRGEGITARYARNDSCPRGHPYDFIRKDGARRCRRCKNDFARAQYRIQKKGKVRHYALQS